MLIRTELKLHSFEFWGGAEDRACELTDEQFDTIEEILSELYPHGIDETQLNDFFWFDEDIIAEWLGFDTFEDLTAQREA